MCLHSLSNYLLKPMGATFTGDHKICPSSEESLMCSPVCDFSGNSTKCWIPATPWSYGNRYRLSALCSLQLPVPEDTMSSRGLISHLVTLRSLKWVCVPLLSTEAGCRNWGSAFIFMLWFLVLYHGDSWRAAVLPQWQVAFVIVLVVIVPY